MCEYLGFNVDIVYVNIVGLGYYKIVIVYNNLKVDRILENFLNVLLNIEDIECGWFFLEEGR